MTLLYLTIQMPTALLAQQRPTDDEINQKFAEKVDSYIGQSEIRVTLEDVIQLKPATVVPLA